MSRKKGHAVADTRQIGESWQPARMTNASLIQTVTFQMPRRKKHLTCVVSVQLGFAGSLFFFFFSSCGLHSAQSAFCIFRTCVSHSVCFGFKTITTTKTTKTTAAQAEKSIKNKRCCLPLLLWISAVSTSPGCPSAQMSGICPLDKEADKSHCSCWCHCQPLAWAVSWKTLTRVWIGGPPLSRAHHVDVFACGRKKKEKKKNLWFWRRGWHCSAAAAISAAEFPARQCRSDSLRLSARDKAWITRIPPLSHRSLNWDKVLRLRGPFIFYTFCRCGSWMMKAPLSYSDTACPFSSRTPWWSPSAPHAARICPRDS